MVFRRTHAAPALHSIEMSQQRPSTLANQALIQAARSGDLHSLDRLLHIYHSITLRVVELRLGRRIRDVAASEDVVQEALIEVFLRLDHFEMRSEGDFRNWLARLVERKIRERLRRVGSSRKRPQRSVKELGLPALGSWIRRDHPACEGTEITTPELEERIERVLMYMLEEPHREVLILRKLCGMSDEETARCLGFARTEDARDLYSEALGRLRERLEA